MLIEHINRITGDQNQAAPLYAQSGGTASLAAKYIFGAPFSIIAQATNPHRLLFMQAVVLGLFISNIHFEDLTISTGLTSLFLIFGIWVLFYIPILSLVTKITMSFIYGLVFYRLFLLIWDNTTVLEQTFSIEHLATDVPIATSPVPYSLCLIIFAVTMFMQRNVALETELPN